MCELGHCWLTAPVSQVTRQEEKILCEVFGQLQEYPDYENTYCAEVRKRREKNLRSLFCGYSRMWQLQPAALGKQQFTVELTQSKISSCHPTKQKQFGLIQQT